MTMRLLMVRLHGDGGPISLLLQGPAPGHLKGPAVTVVAPHEPGSGNRAVKRAGDVMALTGLARGGSVNTSCAVKTDSIRQKCQLIVALCSGSACAFPSTMTFECIVRVQGVSTATPCLCIR